MFHQEHVFGISDIDYYISTSQDYYISTSHEIFIYLFIYLFTYLFIHSFIYLFIYHHCSYNFFLQHPKKYAHCLLFVVFSCN